MKFYNNSFPLKWIERIKRIKRIRTRKEQTMINDDWTPDFVKVAPRSVEDDDPLKLEPNAMSLEGLQAIYRNPALPLTTRMRAMMATVPYESPKLIATAIVNEGSSAELLDQRLKRLQEMEMKAINGGQIDA